MFSRQLQWAYPTSPALAPYAQNVMRRLPHRAREPHLKLDRVHSFLSRVKLVCFRFEHTQTWKRFGATLRCCKRLSLFLPRLASVNVSVTLHFFILRVGSTPWGPEISPAAKDRGWIPRTYQHAVGRVGALFADAGDLAVPHPVPVHK